MNATELKELFDFIHYHTQMDRDAFAELWLQGGLEARSPLSSLLQEIQAFTHHECFPECPCDGKPAGPGEFINFVTAEMETF
jgi:hypothetical protein